MLYSKTCEYAIRALSYFPVHPENKRATVQDISAHSGVPAPYVSKIFQCLVQNGIVESHRGARGGYSLKIPASKISLMRVIRAMDDLEKSPFTQCIMGLHQCNDREPCPLHSIWADTKEKMMKKLSDKTVADVAHLVDKYDPNPSRIALSESMRSVFGL